MATRMTAAEYERMYGVKPVFSGSSIDTTPAPVRMTMTEYNNLYNPKEQTFGETAKTDIQDAREAMKESVNKGGEAQSRITNRYAQGEISKSKAFFQKVGTGALTAIDTLGQGAFGVAKAALPDGAEQRIDETLGEDIRKITDPEAVAAFEASITAQDSDGGIFNSQVIKDINNALGKNAEETINAYRTDETFRTDVKAAGGFLSWLNLPGATKKTVTTGIDAVTDAASSIDGVTSGIRSQLVPSTDKTIAKLATEISNIEDKYKPLRTANKFSPDADDSRKRIAASNVLENAVDTNGQLRTEDAAAAYRNLPITRDGLTIKDVEGVVRRNLENENKTINLRELERDLIDRVMNTRLLEGGDLTAALKGIGRELDGLSKRADEFGNIPLVKIQDAKIATTGNINFNTPAGDKTYRKALARGFKEIIENKSDLDVKKVNSELAKYYRDIERIEKLDGRRVEGGRLGKYSAALAGSAVGAVAGSAGGPLTSAVAGIAGGELGSAMKGRTMSNTFKSGLDGELPQSDILADAQRAADAGPRTNLKVPDKAVGAPKGVVKNKEITQLESRIKNNVAEQKKAIKANDFTLVETLKVIYAVLVDKLKEQIKVVKTQSIPLKRNQQTATKKPNKTVITKTVANTKPGVKADRLYNSKELPNNLQERQVEVAALRDSLAADPAAPLMKYAAKRGEDKMTLKEVLGGGTTKFGKTGDSIVTELGFTSTEQARKAFAKYVERKDALTELEAELKSDISSFKAEKKNAEEVFSANSKEGTIEDFFEPEVKASLGSRIKKTLTDQTGSVKNPLGGKETDLQRLGRLRESSGKINKMKPIALERVEDYLDHTSGVNKKTGDDLVNLKADVQLIAENIGVVATGGDAALAKGLRDVLDSRLGNRTTANAKSATTQTTLLEKAKGFKTADEFVGTEKTSKRELR